MIKHEMTAERKNVLEKMLKWYWDGGLNLITKSDYEFLYDVYDHGLSFYGDDVQGRLNEIRDIYLNNVKPLG